MPETRGFTLKHRVAALFRRNFSPAHRRRRQQSGVWGFMEWAQRFRLKAKSIGVGRVKRDPVLGKPVPVPKGHMAVYVGQEGGGFERILVPVVYFNHPLFGDLLRESENEFGFDQPGRFTIPCRISEFERVQTRIKTGWQLKRRSW